MLENIFVFKMISQKTNLATLLFMFLVLTASVELISQKKSRIEIQYHDNETNISEQLPIVQEINKILEVQSLWQFDEKSGYILIRDYDPFIISNGQVLTNLFKGSASHGFKIQEVDFKFVGETLTPHMALECKESNKCIDIANSDEKARNIELTISRADGRKLEKLYIELQNQRFKKIEPKEKTKESVPEIYAVLVGVKDYSSIMNSKKVSDLLYADKDAELMFDHFTSRQGGQLSKDNIILLTNEEAKSGNIKNACKELFLKANEEDMIIFYFSGHGQPYLFYTYDETIPQRVISNIMRRSKAKNKLCIADACYSGTWDKKPKEGEKNDLSPLARALRAAQAFSSGGTTFIMSAQGNETSLEDIEKKFGIFTYFLFQALQGFADNNEDGIVTLSEIMDYLKMRVPKRASYFENHLQTPVINGVFNTDLPLSFLD